MSTLSKVFVRGIPIGLTLVALAFAGGVTSLQAQPLCVSGTQNLGNGGTLTFSQIPFGSCVEVGDKLYGNFIGGTLPANTPITFATSTNGVETLNSVTFNGANLAGGFLQVGPSFAVSALGGNTISAFSTDFTQTMGGPTTLTQTLSPAGSGLINVTKTGDMASGNDLVTFSPGVTDLAVSSMLSRPILGSSPSDASAILDTIIEPVPVSTPEPAALGLLGIALTGLGVFGLRRKS